MIKELSILAPSFSYMTYDLLHLTLNSLSELLCHDISLTYVLLFDLLKQCFGRLKKALAKRNPKAVSKLYGYKILFTLKLILKITAFSSKIKNGLQIMSQLRYPIVELVNGLLELSPQTRYYPLFLHFLRVLLELGEILRVRIPLLHWIEKLYKCADLRNGVRGGSNVKGFDFEIKLRADLTSLKSNFYWTDLCRQLMYVLMRDAQNNLHLGKILYIF